MVLIVNAVEHNKSDSLELMVDEYLRSNADLTIFTDNIKIKEYCDYNYFNRCIYNESLVALWFRITNNSVLVITDINNMCSEVYKDLSKVYSITFIEKDEKDTGGLNKDDLVLV